MSFDENPSRYDLTGHGGKDPVAEEFAPEWVVPDEFENPTALAEIIAGAEVLDIPNRDHMRAVGDKVYKTGVLEFLSQRK